MDIVKFSRYDVSQGKEMNISFEEACKIFEKPVSVLPFKAYDIPTHKKEISEEKARAGMVFWGKTHNGMKKLKDIISHSAIALDYDDINIDKDTFLKKLAEVLDGVNYLCYSTTKCTKDKLRVRVIVPLSRPTKFDEYQACARAMISKIGTDGIDSSSIQDNRAMGLSCVLSGEDYIYIAVTDNKDLDVDDFLAKSYKDWRDASEWIDLPNEKKKKINAERRTNKDNNGGRKVSADEFVDIANKKGIEGAFCRCYSIADAINNFLPDVYKASDAPDRFTYVNGSSEKGLVVFGENGGQACFSFHSTDPANGQILNAFDLVRIHKYGYKDTASEYSSKKKRPSYQDMKKFAEDIPDVKRKLLKLGLPSHDVSPDFMKLAAAFVDIDEYPANDYGVGKMLSVLYNGKIAWASDIKGWLKYDGKRWQEVGAPEIISCFQTLTDIIKTLAIENDDADFLEHASTCIKYCQQSYLQKQAIEHIKYFLSKKMSEMDSNIWILNTPSGTIDLSNFCTGDDYIRNHDEADNLTKITGASLPDDFVPDEECLKFLHDIFPDDEVFHYVQKYAGYTLSGSTAEKNMLILYAEHGNNGKTVFNNLWQAVMGDYAMGGIDGLILASKMDKSGSAPNPALAAAKGMRLIVWDEIPEGKKLDSALIKRMTGSGTIVTRKCFQDVIQFQCEFKGSIACNDIPAMQDANDKAMQMRIRCIPFDAVFSEKLGNLDKTIGEEKIYTASWKSTFLQWALEGFCYWQAEGLDNFKGGMELSKSNLPARMKECMREYFKESDDIGDFLLTYVDFTEDFSDFLAFDDLYKLYISDSSNNYNVSKRMFAIKVRKAISIYNVKADRKRISDSDGYVRNASGWYGCKRLDFDSY